MGGTVGEVPIIFIERRAGASKMSGRVLLESMIMPWRLVWRHRGRLKPLGPGNRSRNRLSGLAAPGHGMHGRIS